MVAERAWPLMKLGRYREARLAAELGLATDRAPVERVIALNALCAIEFEAGNDGAELRRLQARDRRRPQPAARVSAVDLTNFAESSRSLFKLDEAERVSLEATDARRLVVRQSVDGSGRALPAPGPLRRSAERAQARARSTARSARRTCATRTATRLRRALASFLLVLATRATRRSTVTGRALAAPERRAHNSRDPAQDRIVLALLDRRAPAHGRRAGARAGSDRAVLPAPAAHGHGALPALAGALQSAGAGAALARGRCAPGRARFASAPRARRSCRRGSSASCAMCSVRASCLPPSRERAPAIIARVPPRTTTRWRPKWRGLRVSPPRPRRSRAARSLLSGRPKCCCRRG